MTLPATRPLDVFIVAGEESGDKLAAPLMQALKARTGGNVRFRGVGGAAMDREGLASLFPMDDVTAIGFGQVIAKLPLILRRIRETAAAATLAPPDVLVLVDSPDFTHRVARRVRKVLPDLPVVKYVSPTIWMWRPGRARVMRAYVDHILALFPFEPAAHEKLGGPACTYVGHPLLEKLADLRPSTPEETAARNSHVNPLVLVLPGSRRSEIHRLGKIFGGAVGKIKSMRPDAEFVLPTLPTRIEQIHEAVASWPVKPRVIASDEEKYAAFRRARAALAASGTVTLELALSQVPMVTAYKVPRLEGVIVRPLLSGISVILPNILLNENLVPEFLQTDCTPDNLAKAMLPLINGGPERDRQVKGLARLDQVFEMTGGDRNEIAASVILDLVQTKTGRIAAPRP